MKRTILILSLAAAVFAACEKDHDETSSDPCPIAKVSLVSYAADSIGGPFSKYLEMSMEPRFDDKGRFAGAKRQVWAMTLEMKDTTDIFHFLQDLDETIQVVYNPDHTGKLIYKGTTYSYRFPDGVVTQSGEPHDIEIPLVFSDDWYIIRSGESTYEYEYVDGYLQEYDVTWQDGDLMKFWQYSFTYTQEPNPFRDWIDFTAGSTSIPEEFGMGLLGKHTAHIPATVVDEESMAPLTTVTVTKDQQGRITQLRYDREGEDTAYSTLEIQYK